MKNEELYDSIYGSIVKHRQVATPEEKLFVHELTLEAAEGVQDYITELEEAVQHLQTTIRRLSNDD